MSGLQRGADHRTHPISVYYFRTFTLFIENAVDLADDSIHYQGLKVNSPHRRGTHAVVLVQLVYYKILLYKSSRLGGVLLRLHNFANASYWVITSLQCHKSMNDYKLSTVTRTLDLHRFLLSRNSTAIAILSTNHVFFNFPSLLCIVFFMSISLTSSLF